MRWKDTWEHEDLLKDYKSKIQEYWNKCEECYDYLPMSNPSEKPSPFSIEDINRTTMLDRTDKSIMEVNCLKRRTTHKLENIVSKLKKSKQEDCRDPNNNNSNKDNNSKDNNSKDNVNNNNDKNIENNNKDNSTNTTSNNNNDNNSNGKHNNSNFNNVFGEITPKIGKIWSPYLNQPNQPNVQCHQDRHLHERHSPSLTDRREYDTSKEFCYKRQLRKDMQYFKRSVFDSTSLVKHTKNIDSIHLNNKRGNTPEEHKENAQIINESNSQYRHDVDDWHDEKSSFVTQLEEKDHMNYLNTLTMASTYKKEDKQTEREGSDNDSSGGESSSSENKSNYGESVNMTLTLESYKGNKNKIKLSDNLESDKIAETKCEKCNKRFYRRSQLLRHLSNHVVHECHKCHAVFYCVRKFKRHLATHESFPCEFCDEEFYDASAWYHHRAKHTMMECSSCDMVFYNKSSLLKHRIAHSEYVCPVCYHGFKDMNIWLPHRAYHGRTYGNTINSPLLRCTECKRTFSTQDIFLKHKCIYPSRDHITARDSKVSPLSKQDISDLIGVDQTSTFKA